MKIMNKAKIGSPKMLVGFSYMHNQFNYFFSDGKLNMYVSDGMGMHGIQIENEEEVIKTSLFLLGINSEDLFMTGSGTIQATKDGVEIELDIEWECDDTHTGEFVYDDCDELVLYADIDVNKVFGEDPEEGMTPQMTEEQGIVSEWGGDDHIYALKGHFTPEFVKYVRKRGGAFTLV